MKKIQNYKNLTFDQNCTLKLKLYNCESHNIVLYIIVWIFEHINQTISDCSPQTNTSIIALIESNIMKFKRLYGPLVHQKIEALILTIIFA